MTTTISRPVHRKEVRGIDWKAIMKAHPELEAPGYHETLQRIRNAGSTDRT